MKYVRIDVVGHGATRKMCIAFPNDITHSVVGSALEDALRREFGDFKVDLVHAGDVTLSASGTYGKSDTLGLSSNPDDKLWFMGSDYAMHIEGLD